MLVLNNIIVIMVMAEGCHQAAQLQQPSPQPGNCDQEWVASFTAKGLKLKTARGALFMAEKRDQQSCLYRLGSRGHPQGGGKSLPSVLVFLKG